MNLVDRTGQQIPSCTFQTRVGDSWKEVSTDELFKNKKVVVFSLPGAFTPTCSSTHLPRYNELANAFQENGIDDILCVSVNDTFVMHAWAADEESDKITMIPDGNCDFTDGMGMLVDKNNLGFGKRSWRYSMLVNDGKIEKMFIEPQKEGDPFEVSDADTMLKYVAPEWKAQESIAIFTKPGCQFCTTAKKSLDEKGLAYEEIVLGKDASIVSIRAITGKTSAPQVFIGGKYIGSSEDLATYLTKK